MRFVKVYHRDAWVDSLTGREIGAITVFRGKYRPTVKRSWPRTRRRYVVISERDIARCVGPLPQPWKQARVNH